MAIVINGSGTVTGISVGGLPDSIVDSGTLADNAVGLAQMASGTDGNVITYDASGNPAVVATGSSGQVLTSAGAGAAPTMAAGGDDNAPYFEAKNSSTQTPTDGAWTKMDMDTELFDSGGMFASGRFTPTVAGKYYLCIIGSLSGAVNSSFYQGDIAIYKNGTVDFAPIGIDQSSNYGKTAVFSVACISDMNGSSDYVEAWVNMNDVPGAGGTPQAGSACRFFGYRIG